MLGFAHETEYTLSDFLPIWRLFTDPEVIDQLQDVATFRNDLVDVTRQALVNLFSAYYNNLIDVYQNASASTGALRSSANSLLGLILDLDGLLGTNENFLLGRWIRDARSWATSPSEQDLFEFNARNQLTLWGPSGQINDYASKQWSGLVSSYYFARWNLFTEFLIHAKANNEPFDETGYQAALLRFEQSWNGETGGGFPADPLGNTVEAVHQIAQTYFSAML